MKIAMVAGSDLTLSPRIRRHARALSDAGHRVTVYGVLSRATEGEEDEAGVVYVRVPLRGWRAGSGPRHPVRLARWFERLAPVVATAIARDPPEAIHAFDLDAAVPAHRAAVRLGLPLVYDVSGSAYADRIAESAPQRLRTAKAQARAAALRLVRRRADAHETRMRRRGLAATVADTASLAADLERRYGGPRAIVVRSVPAKSTPRRTDALRRRIGAHPRDRILVLPGPIDEGCGVETAIRSLRLLGDRYLLVLLGATPRLSRFEKLAFDEGVAAQVKLVAPAPSDETANSLASADVALVPTEPRRAVDRLSIPPRFFAALSAGLPVVASDTREVGALVRRTGAGVLYPARSPQDPAALAEGVHTLFADASLAATCAEAARHAVSTQLNWEAESRRLVDLYDELAAPRPRSR